MECSLSSTVPGAAFWPLVTCAPRSTGPVCRCAPGCTPERSKLRGEDVAGVGVHIAARVMAEAAPAEVMVSRTVRDLVVGSDFRFEDRGSHHLKGVDGEWQLFALAGT